MSAGLIRGVIAQAIFSRLDVSFMRDKYLCTQRENIHKENVFLIVVSL